MFDLQSYASYNTLHSYILESYFSVVYQLARQPCVRWLVSVQVTVLINTQIAKGKVPKMVPLIFCTLAGLQNPGVLACHYGRPLVGKGFEICILRRSCHNCRIS